MAWIKRLVPCVLALLLCCGCSLNYGPTQTADGLHYTFSYIGNTCYASTYRWDGDDKTREIHIPDTFDGYRVVSLGGTSGSGSPSAFYIGMPDEYGSRRAEHWGDPRKESTPPEYEYTIQHMQFTLYLGANVADMWDVEKSLYYGYVNPDGSVEFIHPTVYVVCSERNPQYYSVDGKLYERRYDILVDDFEYWSDFI